MSKNEFQTVRAKWIQDGVKHEIAVMSNEVDQKLIEKLDQIDRDIAERPEVLIPLTEELYLEMRGFMDGTEIDLVEPILDVSVICSETKKTTEVTWQS